MEAALLYYIIVSVCACERVLLLLLLLLRPERLRECECYVRVPRWRAFCVRLVMSAASEAYGPVGPMRAGGRERPHVCN